MQSLVVKKLHEGKDYEEAYEEIDTLKKSQIVFKHQKSELTKLRELVTKQEEEIKDLKNKNFKLNIKCDAERDKEREVLKENGNGNCKNIKRIWLIMNEYKEPLCLSDITRNCFIDNKEVLSCLGLLEFLGKIKMEKDSKGTQEWKII